MENRAESFKREFIELLKKYDLELFGNASSYDDEASAYVGLKGPGVEDCNFISLSEYDGNELYIGDENTPVISF